MTQHIQNILQERLNDYQQKGLLRQLMPQSGMVDFWSNDYLGFARSKELWQSYHDTLANYPIQKIGSTGSRLISGNIKLAEELEDTLSRFHRAEAGLLFSTGYAANQGLIPALARKGDTLITDEWVHASTIDGARLSKAQRLIFRHNDLDDLRAKLIQAKGNIFIAIESVYSMDGDFAPLEEIVKLGKEFGANLIVDEAHATGIYGPAGEGLVVALNLQEHVFARIHTFGKGLGTHGAIVVGSQILKNYLINFARSFIFSTGLSLPNLISIQSAYTHLQENTELVHILKNNIAYFKDQMRKYGQWMESNSQIQCLLIPGNQQAKTLAAKLQQNGIQVKAILSPTVATGRERLRFCLHAFNNYDEIDYLASCFSYALHARTG